MDEQKKAWRKWILYALVVACGLYWASNLLLWFPWSISAWLGMTLMLTASPLLWAFGIYQCLIRYPAGRRLRGALFTALLFTLAAGILDLLFFGLLRGAMQELYHPTTFAGYGFLLVLPLAVSWVFKRRIEARARATRRRDFLAFGALGLFCLLALSAIIRLNVGMENEQSMLEELRSFDTPSVTNVVATYPKHPLCLGLYNPWTENWYTDSSVRCLYPELGAVAGYAVTCVYGLPDPGFARLSFADVLEALERQRQPAILVLQQKFPPALASKVGLAGGLMTTALKALGCVGVVSNGPSRDIDEIRPLKVQYLLGGVTPGHGQMAVHAVGVPVSVAGMDVAPGEIVHMDENGACRFPAEHLARVLANLRALRAEEEQKMGRLRQARSAAEMRAIFGS